MASATSEGGSGILRIGVTGIAATSSVTRARGVSGLAYVLPHDLRRVAPPTVHGATVLFRMDGRDSAVYAEWLARRYPGPQAVIARSFSGRCLSR